MAFSNPLNLERIIIEIDPETLEFRLDMNLVNLGHMHSVLKEIIRKIEESDFGDDITATDNEGRELTSSEVRKILKGS